MYELKQSASIEKYIMEIDDMISKTSVKVLPDMLFKAMVLKHMRTKVQEEMMKKQDILTISKQEFILRATRIDDINFKLKIGTTKETSGGGGKKFNKHGGFKSSKAQSSFDKKRIAAIKATQRETKSAELEAKVAAVGKDKFKRERKLL